MVWRSLDKFRHSAPFKPFLFDRVFPGLKWAGGIAVGSYLYSLVAEDDRPNALSEEPHDPYITSEYVFIFPTYQVVIFKSLTTKIYYNYFSIDIYLYLYKIKAYLGTS